MKRYYISVMALILILTFTTGSVLAHPGNTASDGCHYCRTNCDSWGVAWNERHCHTPKNISIDTPPVEYIPIPTEPVIIIDPATPIPTRQVYPTKKLFYLHEFLQKCLLIIQQLHLLP